MESRIKEGRSKLLRPTPRVLPPIGSEPLQHQQQSGLLGAVRLSSSPPAAVDLELFLGDRLPSRTLKSGAPRPLCRKNRTGLDHAHPLKPLVHTQASRDAPNSTSSSFIAPDPPAVAKATTGDCATNAEQVKSSSKVAHDVALTPSSHVDKKNSHGKRHDKSCQVDIKLDQEDGDTTRKNLKLLQEIQKLQQWLGQEKSRVAEEIRVSSINPDSCVMADRSGRFVGNLRSNLRTPPEPCTLPPLGTSAPATVSTVPVPPKATKPQATNAGQFRSRLPRLSKTSTVSVATAVEEQNSVECLTVRKEEGRKMEEIKEEEKRMREAKQRREKERERRRQQAKELPEPDRLTAVPHPEQTLLQAFRLLSTEEWENKVKALTSIRCLCVHHTEVLLPRLHDLCLAVTQEVKNLSSVVSRSAMVTLAHLYTSLGRDMDAEVEGAARVLLSKAGEASGFVREDAKMALSQMVLSVSPSRSLAALINTGLNNRCVGVRVSAAQHLGELAKTVGSSRLLSSSSELTEHFIHAVSCFAVDSAYEVRTHARNTLALLSSHPNIIRMVDKFAPLADQPTIKDIINKCQHRNVR